MSQNWAGLHGFLLEGTGTGNCAVGGYARVAGYSVICWVILPAALKNIPTFRFLCLRFELLMHVRWSSGFL
jgi:hypothetical protein